MDHVVERGYLLIRIGDDRIIHRRILRFIDIVDPALVRIQRIDTDCNDFHPPLFKLGVILATVPNSVVQTGV